MRRLPLGFLPLAVPRSSTTAAAPGWPPEAEELDASSAPAAAGPSTAAASSPEGCRDEEATAEELEEDELDEDELHEGETTSAALSVAGSGSCANPPPPAAAGSIFLGTRALSVFSAAASSPEWCYGEEATAADPEEDELDEDELHESEKLSAALSAAGS